MCVCARAGVRSVFIRSYGHVPTSGLRQTALAASENGRLAREKKPMEIEHHFLADRMWVGGL